MEEVIGSIPIRSTIFYFITAHWLISNGFETQEESNFFLFFLYRELFCTIMLL